MNRNILISFFAIVFLLIGGALPPTLAQENPDGKGQLTVPRDEFKKLLQLRQDEVVLPLETFEKLLAQTGAITAPQKILKNGDVVLSRAEFKKLVDQMKPPTVTGTQPPFDYLITKATYSGKMKKNNTSFTGTFHVHVMKKGVYLKVPILPQNIALEDVRIAGNQALVVRENGYHNVILTKPGENIVTASFSLKSSFEKGPHKLDLIIQQTPITLFNLSIPLKNIDVEIPQAQQVVTGESNGTSNISAIIAPGRSISVRWRKRAAPTEKLPPKLYSELHHLISIEDDVWKINSTVQLNILHSEMDRVRFEIPQGVNILRVFGEGVGEWQEVVQNDQRILLVPFTYAKKGGATINVSAEMTLSAEGSVNAFSGLQVLDTIREIGFIGIELNTSAEVKVTDSEGLERVPVQKLPAALYNKSVKPLILGFKYLKHPYDLALNIQKHDKIAVPVATINSANVVTLFTEDGKIVHRLVYQVRNSAKQFLEIQLPENAQVWSVFVGNQPVESSLNDGGKLLVPLIRSRTQNNRLDTFPVEVLYCMVDESFSPLSLRKSSLPKVDVLVSQLIWSVYLPNDYSYIHFTSTLEKEEIIRGLNLFSSVKREYDESSMRQLAGEDAAMPTSKEHYNEKLKKAYKRDDYSSQFRNQSIAEEQMASQVGAELEFGRRLEGLKQSETATMPLSKDKVATGVLPIQIQIPTGGQVYRFAKTIITDEDPLTMSVVYTQAWVISLVKWLIYALIVWVFYLKRKDLQKFLQRFKAGFSGLVGFYEKHETRIKQALQSMMTPFVLLGLFIVFWFLFKPLALMIFFFLWLSVVYQFFLNRQKKAIKIEVTE